jgi:hypothetical protein
MHARDLVELAALVAVHARPFVESPRRIPRGVNEDYWAASKCRLDRWTRLLKKLADAAGGQPRPPTLSWQRIRPTLEEIIATELLTRLWAAAAAAYDAARDEQELAPVARNVLAGHLDVRRRLLSLLADGQSLETSEAAALDQLRRRIERWTDMLLAHFAPLIAIDPFAFDPARASDFADDLDAEAVAAERGFTSQLVLASLRASVADALAERAASGDLNCRIGTAILSALRYDFAASAEVVKSLWLERMSQTARDTEGMIEELLNLDRYAAT